MGNFSNLHEVLYGRDEAIGEIDKISTEVYILSPDRDGDNFLKEDILLRPSGYSYIPDKIPGLGIIYYALPKDCFGWHDYGKVPMLYTGNMPMIYQKDGEPNDP